MKRPTKIKIFKETRNTPSMHLCPSCRKFILAHFNMEEEVKSCPLCGSVGKKYLIDEWPINYEYGGKK